MVQTRTSSRAFFFMIVFFILSWTSVGGEESAGPIFEELSQQVSHSFVHFNGMTGELYFPEVFGSGVALADIDNDGDLDLFLVQGSTLDPAQPVGDAARLPEDLSFADRLFRNDLAALPADGTQLQFRDITTRSGIREDEYGMGVATGDYDNDGFIDLYVANLGPNRLWHNNGDGTFSDVTGTSGTDDRAWTVAATFVDLDRDGWLDLYVVNYVKFALYLHRPCFSESAALDYCGPFTYEPVPDRLFRNRGDGTFEDISLKAGIQSVAARGLGVVATDFENDGWMDLYVTNDDMPNFLWLNQRNGTLRDSALLTGSALNRDGEPEASMGIDAADFDGDGDEDLFMTHLRRQTNTLYVNSDGSYHDRTLEAGLATPSWSYTGFGTGWLDYDNDGWLDLLVVNGEIKTIEALAREGDPYPLHQPNQLFHNRGDGTFEDSSSQGGEFFRQSEVSRGAAFGDLDNDGDSDVVVANNSGPARVLINRVGSGRHWIGLRLTGEQARRDLLGTKVVLRRATGRSLLRRVHTDGSYASASDPRILIGLGSDPSIESIRAWWPEGAVTEYRGLPADSYTAAWWRQSFGSP